MTFETSLRAQVLTVADNVYWTVRPQSSPLPAVVLTVVADAREQDLESFTNRNTRVQFDVWALDRAGVVTLREAVIAAVAGPFLRDGIQFQRGIFDEVADRGSDTDVVFVHRDQFDVTFRHNG